MSKRVATAAVLAAVVSAAPAFAGQGAKKPAAAPPKVVKVAKPTKPANGKVVQKIMINGAEVPAGQERRIVTQDGKLIVIGKDGKVSVDGKPAKIVRQTMTKSATGGKKQ